MKEKFLHDLKKSFTDSAAKLGWRWPEYQLANRKLHRLTRDKLKALAKHLAATRNDDSVLSAMDKLDLIFYLLGDVDKNKLLAELKSDSSHYH